MTPSLAERLAEAVRNRRLALGDLTQAQVAERGGPSTETLRLIEGARQDRYGPRTLDRLDRALAWPAGTSASILAGTAGDSRPATAGDDVGDWASLAAEVRNRRERLRLPVDLTRVGGPAEMTVRKIESGEPVSIRPKTKTLLENALNMPAGFIDRILDGTATAEEMTLTAADSKPAFTRPRGLVTDADRAESLDRSTIAIATELIARLGAQPNRSPAAEVALDALHCLLPELWRQAG